MFRVDLHTHSSASPDGGISAKQYGQILSDSKLHYIAVTDHNRIDHAQALQQKWGDNIIVGEEITTTAGEIIGLFLTQPVTAGQTPLQTVQAIHAQHGLVYIPHPFETIRSGVTATTLDEIANHVDVIEVHNGRAMLQNFGPRAATWAKINHCVRAASSDAHGAKGLGYTFTEVNEPLTRDNFLDVLGHARLHAARPPLTTLLYPKINRLRNTLGSKKWQH